MSVLKTYGQDAGIKPSKTYRLNGDRLAGKIDGLEAVAQAVKLLLSTERFRYLIYSNDYGVEIDDLIGKQRSLVVGDIQRRIEEALEQDDRVTGVEDFELAFDGETAHIKFTVTTQFGNIPEERSVPLG